MTEADYYDYEDDGLMDTIPAEDMTDELEDMADELEPPKKRSKGTLPPDAPKFPANLIEALTTYGTRHREETEPDNPLELMEPVTVATALAIMEAGRLTEREHGVICLRFIQNMTYYDVGEVYGVTRERIRQVEMRALRKMLRPTCKRIMQKGFYRWAMEEIEAQADQRAAEAVAKFKRDWMEEHEAEQFRAEQEKEADLRERVLNQSIDELDLSVRSYNCLKRANVNTVRDLTERTEESMYCVRNLGRRSLEEIRDKLASLGLAFADRPKKHAAWEPNGDGQYVRCTNCGAVRQAAYMADYCKDCGAKMDGEKP
jgi:hypothetical protein